MSLQTDFNVSPYYDDYNEAKDFYKILFRPSVAVQARELNQLQTILQKQIERFGNNIFRQGTIIDGCHMSFHDHFPYIKINDSETDGTPVNVSAFKGMYVTNSANLQAIVVQTISGYESTDPDLNTLYLRYINSGSSKNDTSYTGGDILTVYDKSYPINQISVVAGSNGFTSADQVVFVSALAVQNTSGGTTLTGLAVNDIVTICDPVTLQPQSNVQGTTRGKIVAIDNVTNANSVIISLKPISNDLNLGALGLQTANTSMWTFVSGDIVANQSNNQFRVISQVGAGASATVTTDALGQLVDLTVIDGGSGYYSLPFVTVASKSASNTQIDLVSVEPTNYLAQITVNNTVASPVGTGYAMVVDDGIIYQKGYFSRASKQLIVVEKYNNQPDLKVVGFNTQEEIINSNIDTSLLDNAGGTFNSTAPGANRLKLTPNLVVLSKSDADANTDFLPIAQFSVGIPYIQNQQTVYNVIEDEIAKRTYEEAGNFVLDQFLINTKSPINFVDEASKFALVVDPGLAYVKGYRVETLGNATFNNDKGIDTKVVQSATVSLDYGSYITVNELGGMFDFATGAEVSLYDTPYQYITNFAGNDINAPLGTMIGEAKVRSVVFDAGKQGSSSATYRVYLFDIVMNPGKNFKDTRTLYLNDGTNKGTADVVLSPNPATNVYECILQLPSESSMLFYTGIDAMKNANSVQYTYRTTNRTATMSSGGLVSVTLGGSDGSEVFPYTGNVYSTSDKNQFTVIPRSDMLAANAYTGTASIATGNNVVTGSGTTFLADVHAGDYVQLADGTNTVYGCVASVADNTTFTLTANVGLAVTGGTVKKHFPTFTPIPLDNYTINVSTPDQKTLTINLGMSLTESVDVVLAYNVRTTEITGASLSRSKSARRNIFARPTMNGSTGGLTGPWCLGVPDIFRLKKVYLGKNNTTFTPADLTSNTIVVTDVTNSFYIDSNQNENFYDIGYLYLKPQSTVALEAGDSLLVQFDAFVTTGEGLKSISSYGIADALTLTQLDAVAANNTTSASINTLEIPEIYDTKGRYYDLRDQMDFRPIVANTIPLTTDPTDVTINNPVEPTCCAEFSTAPKKFPLPGSDLICTIEYYVPRVDRVIMDTTNNIRTIRGIPGTSTPPSEPVDTLTLNLLNIAQYPTMPNSLSPLEVEIADVKVVSQNYAGKRTSKYKVTTQVTNGQRAIMQPRAYTMADIGALDRRISDLEYYVSLSIAEQAAQQKVIPSQIDASIDRFKFGFIVDPFNDYSYSDTNNPEFSSSILDGRLVPAVDEITIKQIPNPIHTVTAQTTTGKILSLPFTEYTISEQNMATDGPVVTETATTNVTTTLTTAPVAIAPVVPTTPTLVQEPSVVVSTISPIAAPAKIRQVTVASTVVNKTEATSLFGNYYEDTEYFMSTQTGTVNMYYNFAYNPCRIEVYYGTTPNFTISASDVPYITSDSAQELSVDDLFGGAANFNLTADMRLFVTVHQKDAKFAKEGSGVLTWAHQPTRGLYVKVRIIKYWVLSAPSYQYKYNIYYPSDSNEVRTSVAIQPDNFSYKGIVTNVYPASFNVQTSLPYCGITTLLSDYGLAYNPYVASAQMFQITVNGLKPNTYHKFMFGDEDQTQYCRMFDGEINPGNLLSDASGMLTFEFYYNSGINIPITSDTQEQYRILQSICGVKSFSVVSSDSISSASGTITINNMVADGLSTGTNPNMSSFSDTINSLTSSVSLGALGAFNFTI